MRITKLGHACVRVEHAGTTVVLDPGVFTDPGAVDGADVVLITHEHPDHYLPEHLRATDARIFAPADVAARIREDAPDVFDRVSVLRAGEQVDVGRAGGLPVTAVGQRHAVIHPELAPVSNTGYVLALGDTRVYHPGDALCPPDAPVDLLLLPVSAPWLKISEAIDFARSVGAPRNLAIHDRVYSEAGLRIAEQHLSSFLGANGQDYTRLTDGQDL